MRVLVTAAPEKGRANAALEKVLAGLLGIPGSHVSIVAGHKARRKRVRVDGVSLEAVRGLVEEPAE